MATINVTPMKEGDCWECYFRKINPRVLAWKCTKGHKGDKRK